MTTTDAAAPGLKLATRAQLQKKPVLRFEDVPCPELVTEEMPGGCLVRVQALTAIQRDELVASCMGKDGRIAPDAHYAQKQLALAIVDETGKQAVSAQVLQSWPAAVIDRCFAVSLRFSDINDAKVEAALGNSALGPTDASSSAGPGA